MNAPRLRFPATMDELLAAGTCQACVPAARMVRVTSHVVPPVVATYSFEEFLEANAADLSRSQVRDLVSGYAIRLGGGAAPIVDVEPILSLSGGAR